VKESLGGADALRFVTPSKVCHFHPVRLSHLRPVLTVVAFREIDLLRSHHARRAVIPVDSEQQQSCKFCREITKVKRELGIRRGKPRACRRRVITGVAVDYKAGGIRGPGFLDQSVVNASCMDREITVPDIDDWRVRH